MKKLKRILVLITLVFALCNCTKEPMTYTSIGEAQYQKAIYFGMDEFNFNKVMVKPNSVVYFRNPYTYSYIYEIYTYDDGNVIFILHQIAGINVNKDISKYF